MEIETSKDAIEAQAAARQSRIPRAETEVVAYRDLDKKQREKSLKSN
ncbi:MAG: hypothetical protein ACR9NN_03560 [Nostochopsis sp.]